MYCNCKQHIKYSMCAYYEQVHLLGQKKYKHHIVESIFAFDTDFSGHVL